MARYQIPSRLVVSRSTLAVGIAVAVWVGMLAGGFGLLWAYKTTPAVTAGQPPERWPSQSRMRPADGRATLVLFAHPRCPCTRASIAELARLMSRVRDRLDAHVLMVRPAGVEEEGWDQAALRDSAARIPGVRVGRDDGGREAERFGAAASGAAVVYDAGGRLVFHGGLTSSRGHEGESAGQRRIVSLLTTGRADRAESPIFGCSLIGQTGSPSDHRTASKEVVE
jgi:hypothetical protein